jgi:hypothetical protein
MWLLVFPGLVILVMFLLVYFLPVPIPEEENEIEWIQDD